MNERCFFHSFLVNTPLRILLVVKVWVWTMFQVILSQRLLRLNSKITIRAFSPKYQIPKTSQKPFNLPRRTFWSSKTIILSRACAKLPDKPKASQLIDVKRSRMTKDLFSLFKELRRTSMNSMNMVSVAKKGKVYQSNETWNSAYPHLRMV